MQGRHWSAKIADIETNKLYSAKSLADFCEARVDTVRNHITRNLERLEIDTTPDHFSERTGFWYGWKLQATIQSENLKPGQFEKFQARLKMNHLENRPCMNVEEDGRIFPTRLHSRSKFILLISGFLLSVGICIAAIWPNDPVKEISFHQSRADLDWLRSRLTSKRWEPYRSSIIRAISSLNPDVIVLDSIEEAHLSTFAVQEGEPFILTTHGILRLGTWVSIDGMSGYISEIKPGVVAITTDRVTVTIPLPKLRVFNKPEPWSYPVTIGLPSHDILGALAEVNGWKIGANPPPLVLYGNWSAKSAKDFIHQIRYDIGLSLVDNELVFQKVQSPRACIGFGDLNPWWIEIGVLCEKWKMFGIKIVGPKSLLGERVLFRPGQAQKTVEGLNRVTIDQNMNGDHVPFKIEME